MIHFVEPNIFINYDRKASSATFCRECKVDGEATHYRHISAWRFVLASILRSYSSAPRGEWPGPVRFYVFVGVWYKTNGRMASISAAVSSYILRISCRRELYHRVGLLALMKAISQWFRIHSASFAAVSLISSYVWLRNHFGPYVEWQCHSYFLW